MAAAAEMPVFVEVRRRLRSALLILGEPKAGGMPMDISVMPSSLQVKTPEGCTETRLPAEVRLAPSTCRGLRYVAGDGLHLRLQAQAGLCAELISVFNRSLQSQECCTFYCQSCGEVIIRDRKLLWENDCFLGDTFFLVNLRSDLWHPRPELAPAEMHCLSSENHFKLKPKANTKVICKRCKVMLGETMSSETTKFYMTEIIIKPSERNFPVIPRSRFVQSVVAQCLVELSSARSTFRFTIQGHDGKVYILLWLLNSDSLVIESLENPRYLKKFPLLEDIWNADSSSAWNAVKVLYQPCIKSRNKKLSSSWESDVSTHSLTMPSTTCLELLLILTGNNATLPPSLRSMDSFQVAFLKM
ncbi:E3 Ubiquitin-Protein Ligase E3D [Manis pentadactyla]|nr:E3 Ubiquitin-Protein Ligase E3D [Manis pentadactyla]